MLLNYLVADLVADLVVAERVFSATNHLHTQKISYPSKASHLKELKMGRNDGTKEVWGLGNYDDAEIHCIIKKNTFNMTVHFFNYLLRGTFII